MAAAAPASSATSIESLGDDQATHFEESAGGTVPSTGQVSVSMRDAECDRLTSSRGLQVTPPAATGASAHMEIIVNSSARAIRATFDGMPDAELLAFMTRSQLAGSCQPQAAPAPQTSDQGAAPVENKKPCPPKSASAAVSGQPQAAPAAGSGQPQAAPAADSSLPQAPGTPTKHGWQQSEYLDLEHEHNYQSVQSGPAGVCMPPLSHAAPSGELAADVHRFLIFLFGFLKKA